MEVTSWNVFVWNLDIYMECTSYDLTGYLRLGYHHFGLNLTSVSFHHRDLTFFWPPSMGDNWPFFDLTLNLNVLMLTFRCHYIRQMLSQSIQLGRNSLISTRCRLQLRLNWDDLTITTDHRSSMTGLFVYRRPPVDSVHRLYCSLETLNFPFSTSLLLWQYQFSIIVPYASCSWSKSVTGCKRSP